MRISDWSSDVCSSDLPGRVHFPIVALAGSNAFQPFARHQILREHGGLSPLREPAVLIGREDLLLHAIARQADLPEPLIAIGIERGVDPFPANGEHAGGGAREIPDQARSEEHTSELQSLMRISYAVFCLKKKKTTTHTTHHAQTHNVNITVTHKQ